MPAQGTGRLLKALQPHRAIAANPIGLVIKGTIKVQSNEKKSDKTI
jgi:hypothetical protein